MESRHLRVAQQVTRELLEREGQDILAVGVMGSVAIGEELPFSDIDMIVLARKKGKWPQRIVDGVLVSGLRMTPKEAEAEVTEPHWALPEILSGWRNLLPIHDPSGTLQALGEKAFHPEPKLLLESAKMALKGAYEDLGKLRNALESEDEEEALEMSLWFSGAAATALSCVLGHVPQSGRTLVKEMRRLSPIGVAIWKLRHEQRRMEGMAALSEGIWADLLAEARRKGIPPEDIGLS